MDRPFGRLTGRAARLLRTVALAALASAAPAAARAGCAPPPDGAPLPYFAEISPGDSVLDVWCRLHERIGSGEFRATLKFKAAGRQLFEREFQAERTVPVVFAAADDPRMQIATLLQSLLPTRRGASAHDPDGQPFPQALEWVVQGVAPATPDSEGLGIPAAAPGARTLALWMPLAVRLAPLRLFGRDFVLQIVFRPRVARYIEAVQGTAERFVLRAAADKVTPFGWSQECPKERVPFCKDLPETVDLYTAWVVESVSLISADQGGLSETTQQLAAWLVQNSGVKPSTNTLDQGFTATEGRAKVSFETQTRKLELVATPDPAKATGTKSIVISWSEKPKSKGTVTSRLDDEAEALRNDLVLRYGSHPTPALTR